MLGVIFSVLAGAAMSFQGVINTRLGEKTGLFEANAFVQGTAFVLSLLVMLIFGDGSLKGLMQADKLYWTGGIFGVAITITVMLAIRHQSPTIAISIILISQLLVAAAIDGFGLLESAKVTFSWGNWAGLLMMLGGVLLFKLC